MTKHAKFCKYILDNNIGQKLLEMLGGISNTYTEDSYIIAGRQSLILRKETKKGGESLCKVIKESNYHNAGHITVIADTIAQENYEMMLSTNIIRHVKYDIYLIGENIYFKIFKDIPLVEFIYEINERENTSVLDRIDYSLIGLIHERDLKDITDNVDYSDHRLKTYDEINSVIGGNF